MKMHLLLMTLIACGILSPVFAAEPLTLRVMSFNLWHGGDGGKQPQEHIVHVIKASQADIVGLQETAGFGPAGQPRPDRAKEIAEKLGWHYLDQGERTGIISRYKIVGTTPRKWGAKIELPHEKHAYLFNAHLAHAPYQPYQLLNIPYADAPFIKTAEEAVEAAKKARGGQVDRMLAEVKGVVEEGSPIFITGDFNEPSHLDWTPTVAKYKLCPVAVEWPSTKAVTAAGFVDTYRSVHPDPVVHPGRTWTPITERDDPKDRHDRIDFVFVQGDKIKVKSARTFGESRHTSDVEVERYPSDHRLVVAEVEIP